jgi:hypothetical protein
VPCRRTGSSGPWGCRREWRSPRGRSRWRAPCRSAA